MKTGNSLARVILGCLAVSGISSCGPKSTDPSNSDMKAGASTILCERPDIDEFVQKMPTPINYYKEVLIISPDVVDDPCRSRMKKLDELGDKCAPGTEGRWAFGTLMANAAGKLSVESFIQSWLETWTKDQTVNGFVVQKRPLIDRILNSQWAKDRFPRDTAPLRLLAIVNRVDLSGRSFPYAESQAGECRFIFGFTNEYG